jgi:hypothetical protein
VLIAAALFFGRYFVVTAAVMPSFLHLFILILHEAGHIIMMPFGNFMMLLGGTLWQIAIPLMIALYFLLSRQFFAAAIALMLVGFSFLDASMYVADASSRQLDLITIDKDTHDWWQLLRPMGLLGYDRFLATLYYLEGLGCYLTGIAVGLRVVRQQD